MDTSVTTTVPFYFDGDPDGSWTYVDMDGNRISYDAGTGCGSIHLAAFGNRTVGDINRYGNRDYAAAADIAGDRGSAVDAHPIR